MGQKTGTKWTAEAVSQPTIPKSDWLLGEHSTGQRKLPSMGTAGHAPLADAPGSYVHVA